MGNLVDRKASHDKIRSLGHLRVGEQARVVSISAQNALFRRRMFDMGITVGVAIKVKKIAPLGDPICIELRGYELCLRKEELNKIEVVVSV